MKRRHLEYLERSPLARERILRILVVLDDNFTPPLSSRVELREYSRKLAERAENIICICDGIDVGHVAIYANDADHKNAFVTSIGVLPEYQGQGIGMELLRAAIAVAEHKGMHRVRLEVDKRNDKAIHIYRQAGFSALDDASQSLRSASTVMEKTIDDNAK